MQLTAREWIELIADPEIREKALRWIKNHPYEPNIICPNIKTALFFGISKTRMSADDEKEYNKTWSNPPALLPFPNKEREQAESILMEFANWTFCQPEGNYTVKDMAADFLNQKYPS